jgi:hypothetical protein
MGAVVPHLQAAAELMEDTNRESEAPIRKRRRLQMRFTRKLALVLVLAAVALAALATTASAATVPSSGLFIEGPEQIIDERQVGDDLWFTIKRDVEVTGTYSGTARFTELVIIEPDGTTHLYGVMEFAGTACGKPARLRFLVTGHGSQVEGFIDGEYVVLGTGRAARRVLGRGTFTGVPGTAGEYVGTADC